MHGYLVPELANLFFEWFVGLGQGDSFLLGDFSWFDLLVGRLGSAV